MTTIALPLLRTSERGSFKKCPAQHRWAWNYPEEGKGLERAMPRQDARWFGTSLHVALATYYAPAGAKNGFVRGPHPAETFGNLVEDAYVSVSAGPYWDDEHRVEFLDAATLGKGMLEGYVKEYNGDPQWEILMPEHRFSAGIPYTARQINAMGVKNYSETPTGTKNIVKFVGTFDATLRDHSDGHVKVIDHKSTGKKENTGWLSKDDQGGGYIVVSTPFLRKAGFIKPDEAVTGAVWNYLRKTLPKPDEMRDENGILRNQPTIKHYQDALLELKSGPSEADSWPTFTKADFKGFKKEDYAALADKAKLKVLGDISKNQGVPLFWRETVTRNRANRQRQIERIAEDAEMIQKVKSGQLPVLKNPGEHCAWCDFTDLCDVDEDGGDADQFARDVFKVRDVYADHRTDAINSKVLS